MDLKSDPDRQVNRHRLGSYEWFWQDLKDTPKNPWNIAVLAEEEDIELFQAINLTVEHLRVDTYAFYSTEDLPVDTIAEIANKYLRHHSKVPYIGKSIYTEQPMTCLTTTFGEDDSQTAKLAYWENGGIYGYIDERSEDISFALIVDDTTAQIFGYPTVEAAKNLVSTE